MDEFWKTIITALSSAGVAGAVLAWYLVKFEPAQKAMEQRFWEETAAIRDEMRREISAIRAELHAGMDKTATALFVFSKNDMLRLVASPHIHDSVKEAAAALIEDIANETKKP